MNSALTASRWDDEYRNRRYVDEPPLPFVDTIIAALEADRAAWDGTGLYVGCGNGRNYLPLVDAGLNLSGLDMSPQAITGLTERRPALRQRLVCGDFRAFPIADRHLDYVIAIQVFQHGDAADVATYFGRVAALLRPGGLFFLRVNSAATDVYYGHSVVERNGFGGFTIRYEEGPKHGLLVHFYSGQELLERMKRDFRLLTEPREDVTRRSAPKIGCWVQWEGVWQRR